MFDQEVFLSLHDHHQQQLSVCIAHVMMMLMIVIIYLVCIISPINAIHSHVRLSTGGLIRGRILRAKNDQRVGVYLGVRYAAPPVGDYRYVCSNILVYI
jgi:hypothetical protein